ncbi:MAG: insulinase family protein, partial [Pseudomonadota bacterium]
MSRFARFCAAALLTAAAALPARAATEVQVVTSPGGIEAWLVEEPSIPMLALEIRFRTGDAGEAEALTGVTSFMASLLDEGAGELDAAAFEAAADRLALRMGFSSSVESFAVSARMLSEKRGDSLALVKSALSAPRFDVAAVERVRARLLASIRSRATDDGWLASNAWRSALMPGHPFARTSS